MIHETAPQMIEVASHEALVLMQRTARGREFEEYQLRFQRMMESTDPAVRAKVTALNQAYVQMRDVSGSVHVDTLMSEFSVRFMNDAYIGTQLLPEVQVEKPSNRYAVWDIRDQLAYPDDAIGAQGDVKQLTSNVDTTNSYTTNGAALEEYVDLDTIDSADAPLQPLVHATLKANDGILWNQERRIIAVMGDSANYGSNYVTIPVGQEWNSAGGGNPVNVIQTAVGSVLPGPGPTKKLGWCSYNVYLALARHPQIRDLHKYTQAGLIPPNYLAQLFDLDGLLVGKAWKDTANKGQSLALARLWPDYFGVANVMSAPMKDSYSFGTTFRWGPKFTEVRFERNRGRRGGYFAKTSTSYVPKVTASYAGYLVKNCLAA